MIVVPFAVEHVDMIDVQETQANEVEHIRNFAEYLTGCYSYSCFDGDEVIFLAGMSVMFEETGEIWCLFSKRMKDYPIETIKLLIKHMDFLHSCGFKRLQTLVDASNPTAKKYIEFLGYENEGLMKRYYKGQDFYRYARIRE